MIGFPKNGVRSSFLTVLSAGGGKSVFDSIEAAKRVMSRLDLQIHEGFVGTKIKKCRGTSLYSSRNRIF